MDPLNHHHLSPLVDIFCHIYIQYFDLSETVHKDNSYLLNHGESQELSSFILFNIMKLN